MRRASLVLLAGAVFAMAVPAVAQIRLGDHGFRLVTNAGIAGTFSRRMATCTPMKRGTRYVKVNHA